MLHNHTGYILTDTSLQVLEMGLAALRATGEESCRLPLEGYASGSRTLTQFDATLTSAGQLVAGSTGTRELLRSAPAARWRSCRR